MKEGNPLEVDMPSFVFVFEELSYRLAGLENAAADFSLNKLGFILDENLVNHNGVKYVRIRSLDFGASFVDRYQFLPHRLGQVYEILKNLQIWLEVSLVLG